MMHHHSFLRLSLLRLSRSSAIRSLSTATGAASTQSGDRVAAIAEEIANLTVLETSHLAELVRQRLGVEQMPQLAVISPGMSFPGGGAAMGQAGAAAGAEVKEEKEKTAFDVKLEGFDAATKIKVIKEVRAFTELGLKEAKELVEKAPIVVKAGVTKEEADKIMEKLKEVGAKVVLE